MACGRSRWRVLLVAMTVAATIWCVGASAAVAAVGPQQIDAFLLAHNSPLAGEGRSFYEEGVRNGVDPAFLVAVSGAESDFGRYLFFAGAQTAGHNAFNWFFAPTRAGSAFVDWREAIATVAAGLRGPLYYGAGRYSVGAIAPVYCPQGTQAWIDNVTVYLLDLGGDPDDTRWRGASRGGLVRPVHDDFKLVGQAGLASALVVARPITLSARAVVAGGRLGIRFKLSNGGLKAGNLTAVILRLQGPSGRNLAFGSHTPLRLDPGASYAFRAIARLPIAGAWRGWIDVQAGNGAILNCARPVLHVTVTKARTGRRRGAPLGRRGTRPHSAL